MDKKMLMECLDNLQFECNRLYHEYNATENIISLQVAINNLRHEYDLPNESECIYEDYVQ
ncbi:hypothetical protein [uncultured Methanobrevibacter sp.]|uniref:hypothetical protein n=1 Tax=uncultured Methanobrevibacter sp. TaxID=253161 RepID=UPI00260E391C|nr:hypothetical protein [uncultured Methanobrevibacter sp.]